MTRDTSQKCTHQQASCACGWQNTTVMARDEAHRHAAEKGHIVLLNFQFLVSPPRVAA